MKKDKRYAVLAVTSSIFAVIYFVWRIFFTMPISYGKTALICAVIFLICEFTSAIEAFIHIITAINPYIPEMPEIPEEWYPEVDVFISTHNESTDILYKTVNGCKHMDYPDKTKVHIWICDDNNRKEMKELAEKMNVGYHGLANNIHAKAGNLNNAISKTNAPLIVTFDSDMIPRKNFLMETVPYFFIPKMKKDGNGKWIERKAFEVKKNFKIGFIQTPQCFYNPDLFQYNLYSEQRIPNEQDYFFREINVSRNNSNSPIYAGSNTVISRQALEEVGGIVTGTITEDFETGLRIQEKGYTCYAIDKALANGLSPDTIDSLIKQRERWGRGCIFSLRRMKILKNKKLSFKAKISYLSCELYWWTFLRRFVFITAPIFFSIFSIPVLVCKAWQLFVIWLPFYYLMNKTQNYAASDIRIRRWSDIIDTVMFPYLIIPIIMEALGIKKRNFVVTRKDRNLENQSTTILAIPHMILLAGSILTLFLSIGQLIRYSSFGSIVMIYWGFCNSLSLTMAVFFMCGRKNYRMYERYNVNLPVKIENENRVLYGQTTNISESGIAILFDSPSFINKEEEIQIKVKGEYSQAEFKAKVVYVQKIEGKMQWKYSFKIIDIDDLNKDEYYQIVYDREPSLTSITSKDAGVFEDLLLNIAGRSELNSIKEEKRKAYRIPVKQHLRTVDGTEIYAEDFNYDYITLKTSEKHNSTIRLVPSDGVEIKCEYVKQINKEGNSLYRILNAAEIAFEEKFETVVNSWIERSAAN